MQLHQHIWSLCKKVQGDAAASEYLGSGPRKFVIQISPLHHTSPGTYFFKEPGYFPFQKVVEGLRLH